MRADVGADGRQAQDEQVDGEEGEKKKKMGVKEEQIGSWLQR